MENYILVLLGEALIFIVTVMILALKPKFYSDSIGFITLAVAISGLSIYGYVFYSLSGNLLYLIFLSCYRKILF